MVFKALGRTFGIGFMVGVVFTVVGAVVLLKVTGSTIQRVDPAKPVTEEVADNIGEAGERISETGERVSKAADRLSGFVRTNMPASD